ncbi:hypothetical protein NQ318_007223 [Aromia moschata]|uniref:Uncharacterized protein n=1 Tax=Aromia moschata TaxID=1265417 RepID=A0AAV8Y5B1_9CUCU|nr:hypothetical protein NQ318_007223 [Aromia moschata]
MEDITTDLQQKVEDIKAESKDVATKAVEQGDKSAEEIKTVEESVIEKIEDIIVDAFESITGAIPSLVEKGEKELEDVTVKSSHAAEDLEKSFVDKVEKKMEETFETIEKKLEHKPENDVPEKEHIEHEVSKTDKDITKLSFVEEKPVTDILEDTSKVNAEHLLDKISESADTMGIEEAKNQLAEISAAVISTVEDIKSTMEEKLTEKAFDEDAKGKEIPVSKAAIAEAAEDIKAKIEETFADKPPKDEQKQSTDDKQTVEETFVPQTVIPVENSKESILEKLDETSKAVVDSVLDGAFEKEIKGRPEDKGKDDVKTETKPSDKNSEAMKEESKKGELSEEVESKKDTEDKEEPTGEKKRRESIVEQLEDGIRGTFSAISDFGKSLFDKGEKVIEDTTASEEHVIEGIKTTAESVIEKVDEEVKSSIASIKHFEESILDSYKCTTNGEKKEVTDKSDDISQKAEIENLKESKIPEFPRDSKSPEMTKLEDLSKTTPIELKETISDQKFHEEIVDKKDPKLVEDLTEKVSPKDEHDTESDKISKTLEEKPSQDKEQDRKESISEIKDTLTEKVLKEKLGTEVKVEPAEEDFKELPKAKLPEAAKIATTDDSVMISKDDSVDLKLDTKIKDGILEEKEERPDLKPEIVAEKTKEVEKSVELVTAKADVKHSEKSDIAEEKDSGIFDSISEIKADLTEKVESEMLEEANEIPDTLKSGEQEKDAIEDIKEIKIKEDSSGGTGTSGKKDTHSDTGEESIELVKEKVKLEIGITDEKSAESQVEPEEGIVSVPLEKSALVITDGTLTTTDVKSPIGKSEEPSEERRSPTKAVEDEKILAKEEAILDKSATDLKKTPDVVPEKIKSEKSSTEEDRDLLKKEEKALEKSAEDIEEEFEIVTDMSKSIVFDKCDTHPQQTSEPGSGKAKSDMTGKTEEVSMHKEDELLKQEERVLEKSEEDIEEAFEAVTDMSKSVVLDKCKSHPQQTSETGSDKVKMDLSGKTEKLKKEDEVLLKKEETALEKSAEDIEEAFEVVTDMSKSVVFDKCEPYSQQTSDTGADKAKSDLPDKTKEESTKKEHEELLKKEEKVLETSAEDIEETFETVTDMSKSVVFDKCETHPHEVSETGADKIKTDLSDKTEKLPTKKEDEELLKKEEQVMAESAEDVEEAFETITDISKSMAFEKCTAHPQQPLENGSDKAKSDLPDKTQKSIEKEHEEVLKKEEKVLEKSAEDIEEAFEIVTDMTKPVIFEKCETHPQQTSETGSDETKSDFTEQSEKSDEMEDKKLLEKEEKVLEKSAEDIKEAFETVTDMSMSVVFDKCTTHPDQTTDVDKTQKSPAEEDKELMKKEGKALGKSVEDLVQASETVADISKSVVLDKNDTHLTEQKSPKNSVEDLTFDKCGISTEVAEIDPKVLKEEQQQLEKSADDLKDTYDRVSKMSTSMSFEKCEKTEDAILHKEEEALEERAKDLTETFETITDMSKSVIFEKCDSVEKRRKSIEDEFVEKTAEDIEEAFETVTDMSKSVIFEKCDKDKEKSDAEKEKFDEKASAELKAEDNIVKDIVDKVTKDVDTKSIEAETKYKSSKGLQEAVGPKIEAKESDIKEVVEKVVAHVDTQSIEAEVKKLPELLVEKQKVEDVKPPIFEKCEKEDMEKTTEPKLESDKTKDLTIDSKDTLPLLEQHHIKDDCKKIDSSLEKQDSKPEKSTLEVSTSEGKNSPCQTWKYRCQTRKPQGLIPRRKNKRLIAKMPKTHVIKRENLVCLKRSRSAWQAHLRPVKNPRTQMRRLSGENCRTRCSMRNTSRAL